MSVRIHIGNVYSKVVCDAHTLDVLREVFKVKRGVQNHFASAAYEENNWNEFRYLIWKNGKFLSRLMHDIYHVLNQLTDDIQIVDQREAYERLPNQTILWNLEAAAFSPRPYQTEAFFAGLENERGIFDMCTGSGKTFVMALLLQSLYRRSCVFVNSVDLAMQLRGELAEYFGVEIDDIGFIGNGIHIEKLINVCVIQTIDAARSKSKKDRHQRFLESLECVVVDEAHHGQASSYQKVLGKAKNAYYRYGFTATPLTSELRDQDNNRFRNNVVLKEWFGPVIFSISTREMIRLGYLAEPFVKIVQNRFEPDEVLEYAQEVDRQIVRNRERNEIISDIASRGYISGKQSIIFVTRVDHGHLIREVLNTRFGVPEDDVQVVTGQDFSFRRKQKIQSFKSGNLPILIGTVLSEGLNVFCDIGINAPAGRSEKDVIQRLGRVLRKKRIEGGNDVNTEEYQSVEYYDFADLGHSIFSKQARERERVYTRDGHSVERLTW